MTTKELIAQVPHWRHRIPLPDGTMTPGSQNTQMQLEQMDLPEDLTGKSVLDVGCSDGFFSFECERRGASRVVAIDDFSSVYVDTPDGFDIAHQILDSKVEFVTGDMFKLDLKSLGSFDLVLFLGVMYHLRNPFLAVETLASVCADHIIIETEIIPEPTGWKRRLLEPVINRIMPDSYMVFLEGSSLNNDPTNWWVQSAPCVEGMLRASGFCDVRTANKQWGRGFFHGRSPAHGNDVSNLVGHTDRLLLDRAYQAQFGTPLESTDLIGKLSVANFGKFKQDVAELRGKEWHQDERWQ